MKTSSVLLITALLAGPAWAGPGDDSESVVRRGMELVPKGVKLDLAGKNRAMVAKESVQEAAMAIDVAAVAIHATETKRLRRLKTTPRRPPTQALKVNKRANRAKVEVANERTLESRNQGHRLKSPNWRQKPRCLRLLQRKTTSRRSTQTHADVAVVGVEDVRMSSIWANKTMSLATKPLQTK